MTEPTRDEVNETLATKVMGYKIHYARNGERCCLWDANEHSIGSISRWNPFGNVEQAFQVLEKMEQDGWRATIYAGAQEKSCVVLRFHEAYHRYGQKVSEGICNAVYAAIAKEGS